MRLEYSKHRPLGFPHKWVVYHVRWMVEVPWVVLVDTDTKDWWHLTDRNSVCCHVANKIIVEMEKRLVIIDPIDDDAVDQNDIKVPTPTTAGS